MTLFLITAPSGVGKTTLAHELESAGYWKECISHTTRPMRNGEVDGQTYYFITKEEFKKMYDNGEFAEHVEYDGNFYALSKKEINRVMEKYGNAFAIVEYNGYTQMKKLYPEAVGIFLWATKEECMINMLSRGDSLESANNRIAKYEEEIKNKDKYDYVIRNIQGKFVKTCHILISIVKQHEKSK